MDPVPLHQVLSHVRDEEVHFLSQFLQLNPRSRISADLAIEFVYFTSELPRPSDPQNLCHFKTFFNESKKRLEGGRKDKINCVGDYMNLIQGAIVNDS